MEPTLYEGDNLITEKITPMLGIFKRGDIVTIKNASPSLEESGKTIIKRIIALEYDVVNISDGKVYINGELLNENYIKGDFTTQVDPQYSRDYVVPKGCVYVLGDNRGTSIIDSRAIGPISTEKINSKAIMIIYPFSRFGILGR
jgi:signal peptidase I